MTERTGFPLARLLVIAGAIFASVTSEFLPTGLLPEIAADLGVSESRVGLLVAVFAGTVVVSTAPLTVLTRNASRKRLMVLLLAGFAITNLLCAVAPSYEVLVVARVLGGLCHGLFWAVTGPYAAHLVDRRRLARALAVTNAGGTAAFVLGVPLGSAIGHLLGWRLAFGAMGAVVLVFALLVVLFLPPVQHLVPPTTGEIVLPARRDPSLPAVLTIAATVLVAVTGHNILYVYIAPWLIASGAIRPDGVAALLFVYGAAGVVGLVLAGVFGDRFPVAGQLVVIGGVAAAVSVLGWAGGAPPIVVGALVAWGAFFSALPPLLHARMMHSASPRIRDLASALMTTAFNLAIGGGALLGGVVLDLWGVDALPWTLVGVEAAAVALVAVAAVIGTRRARGAARPGAAAPTAQPAAEAAGEVRARVDAPTPRPAPEC